MLDKKVKIIATTGPSVNTKDGFKLLAEAGVDIFRINLSHAEEKEIQNSIREIREVEKLVGRPLTIMGDLAGPKIRLEDVEENVFLIKGQEINIYTESVLGNAKGFSLNQKEVVSALAVNAEVYIDDGYIKLKVTKIIPEGAIAEVLVGGQLKSRKGFSAEGLSLTSVGISEKDKKDIQLMIEEKVDAIAISFVQSEEDVLAIKRYLPEASPIYLVAKIETARGVENAEKIIDVADVMMIARGDLGLAVPMAKVPHIQKKLISLCLAKAKPVITATQMLESMINAPMPTRAEVADVANAILDGTDVVMLSAETASGKYPVETVSMMVKVIKETLSHISPRYFQDEHLIGNSVSEAVGEIADQIHSKLIITFTESGRSARRISRHRHPQVIIALSPNQHTIRNLNFSWGVYPELIPPTVDFNNMRKQAKEFSRANQYTSLDKGQPFIIVAGMPFGESGTTNMIFVEKT